MWNVVRRALSTSAVRRKGHALLPEGWQVVIGIECHAQLKVPTKLFSRTLPGSPSDGATVGADAAQHACLGV